MDKFTEVNVNVSIVPLYRCTKRALISLYGRSINNTLTVPLSSLIKKKKDFYLKISINDSKKTTSLPIPSNLKNNFQDR